MQHSLGKREANSPLALAVVALVPLVALVCVRVIVTLGRMGAKNVTKKDKRGVAEPNPTHSSFQRSLEIQPCHGERAEAQHGGSRALLCRDKSRPYLFINHSISKAP